MISTNIQAFVYSFSAICLAVIGPTTGLACIVSILADIAYFFKKDERFEKVTYKVSLFIENKWVLRTQLALIIVLTPALFLQIQARAGESLLEVFVRLTIHPFFTQ